MTKEIVYDGIDWNNDAGKSLIKALSTSIVTLTFFILLKIGNRFKFWANGISSKIQLVNKIQKESL